MKGTTMLTLTLLCLFYLALLVFTLIQAWRQSQHIATLQRLLAESQALNTDAIRQWEQARAANRLLRSDRDRLAANQQALLRYGYRITTRTHGANPPILLWPPPNGHSLEHNN